MSATLYDNALLQKINSWTEKAEVHVYGPGDAKRVIETLADLNQDSNIKLPLIVLSRPDGYMLNNLSKTPQTHNGKKFIDGVNNDHVTLLNAIPITLPYRLTVYTRYEEEADAYMRELIFNLINYPRLKIVLPYYDSDVEHISNVRITSERISTDTNQLSIHTDQVFSYSIELDVDDAYLWDIRTKSTVYITPYTLQVAIVNNIVDGKEYASIEPVMGVSQE